MAEASGETDREWFEDHERRWGRGGNLGMLSGGASNQTESRTDFTKLAQSRFGSPSRS